MYLRSLKDARSAKKFWEEIFMPKSQLGGVLYIFPPGPRGGGCLYFPLIHKSAMYTFVQQRGGGSRRDPNHKSMYKCAYMYVHLSLSPPPPRLQLIFFHDYFCSCSKNKFLRYKYSPIFDLGLQTFLSPFRPNISHSFSKFSLLTAAKRIMDKY